MRRVHTRRSTRATAYVFQAHGDRSICAGREGCRLSSAVSMGFSRILRKRMLRWWSALEMVRRLACGKYLHTTRVKSLRDLQRQTDVKLETRVCVQSSMLPITTSLAAGAALQHRQRHLILGVSLRDHVFHILPPIGQSGCLSA